MGKSKKVFLELSASRIHLQKKTLSTLKCFIKFEFSNGFCPLNLKRIRLNKRQRKIVDFFLLLF